MADAVKASTVKRGGGGWDAIASGSEYRDVWETEGALNRSEPNVNYDVAIVGAGPVGAFLANRLGCVGRRVRLIDKEPKIYALPRAVHFDGEVMRAFQSIGLADEIAAISRASSKGIALYLQYRPDAAHSAWL